MIDSAVTDLSVHLFLSLWLQIQTNLSHVPDFE